MQESFEAHDAVAFLVPMNMVEEGNLLDFAGDGEDKRASFHAVNLLPQKILFSLCNHELVLVVFDLLGVFLHQSLVLPMFVEIFIPERGHLEYLARFKQQ